MIYWLELQLKENMCFFITEAVVTSEEVYETFYVYKV